MPVEIERLNSQIDVSGDETGTSPAELMRLARMVASILAEESRSAAARRDAAALRNRAAPASVGAEDRG